MSDTHGVTTSRSSGQSADEPDASIAYFVSHEAEIEQRTRRWTQRLFPACVAVLMIAGTVLIVPGAVNAVSSAHRSDQTQKHGVRISGHVTSVTNHSHAYLSGGSGGYLAQYWATWYRAEISVQLSAPIAGRSRTTAYSPQHSSLAPGTTVVVLVDPGDPAYAEFPGLPLERSGAWIVLALLGALLVLADLAVLILLALTLAFAVVKRHRRRASSIVD